MSANIDVSETLDKFEQLLRKRQDLDERQRTLEILARWSRDPDLNDESRLRAISLLRTYAPQLPVYIQSRPFRAPGKQKQ